MVTQVQQLQHKVVFVKRDGREVEGGKWQEFINEQ